MKENKLIKKLTSRAATSTVLILVVMVAIIACLQSNFFTVRTMLSYINSFTPLILLAMGQAVGVAAALCARQGCQPRELDVKALQKELAALGVELFD